MSEDFNSQSLSNDIGRIDKEFKSLMATVDGLTTKLGSLSSSLKGTLTGSNSNSGIGTIGVGSSGNNLLGNSFGTTSELWGFANKMGLARSIGGGLVQAIGGIAGGAMAAMPDVSATMGMTQGYYGAAVTSGTTWQRVSSLTTRGLGNGINMVGGTGVVAQTLAAQGILAGGRGLAGGAGQYNNLLTSIKGAAKYMNISNDVASQAIGGMYSGSNSMSMLQNFGIYTTNPNGGQSASPVQQLAMLNDRLTGGGRMSAKEVATALGPGGYLTADLQSIQDPTQRALASQYIRDASKGKFWNSKTYGAELAKSAGGNSQQSQMDVLAAQTKTMNTAASSYIEGMKKITVAITAFEGAMNNFLKSPMGQFMAQLNGGMHLAGKDPATSGAGLAAGAIITAGSTIAGGIGAWKIGKNMLKAFKSSGGNMGETAAAAAKSIKLGALAKAGGWMGTLASLGFQLPGIMSDVNKGKGGSAIGETAGSLAGGALGWGVGAALAPETAGLSLLIPLLASGVLGGIGGAVGKGVGSTYDNRPGGGTGSSAGSKTDTTKGAPKLIHPAGKAKLGTRYKQKDKLHPQGHNGVDFIVAPGTPVQASADGTVRFAGGNAANTMGTNNRTLGLQIEISHGGGYSTVYGHLSAFSVSAGQQVKQGQQIGSSGNSGYSSGPHLHFELRKDGSPIDPSSALGANYAAVVGGLTGAAIGATIGAVAGGLPGLEIGGFLGGAIGALLGYSSGDASKVSLPKSLGGSFIGQMASGIMGMGSSLNGVGGGHNTMGAVGNGSGGSSDTVGSGGGRGPITINVNVASASEAEAVRFARLVKEHIEHDTLINNMRSL